MVRFSDRCAAREFHAEHPVVVVRSAQSLTGHVYCCAITSDPHNPSPTVHKLRRNYNPASPTREVWVICSHLYTVAHSRLRAFQHKGQQLVPKMAQRRSRRRNSLSSPGFAAGFPASSSFARSGIAARSGAHRPSRRCIAICGRGVTNKGNLIISYRTCLDRRHNFSCQWVVDTFRLSSQIHQCDLASARAI